MKVATQIQIKETGEKGHIFHLTDEIDSNKNYWSRFKGDGGGYVGKWIKGNRISKL